MLEYNTACTCRYLPTGEAITDPVEAATQPDQLILSGELCVRKVTLDPDGVVKEALRFDQDTGVHPKS